MSFAAKNGEQLRPDELDRSWSADELAHTDEPLEQLSHDDAWKVARAVIHDESLPEEERLRLMWAVIYAADTVQGGPA